MSDNIGWFDMDSSLFDYEGHMRKALETLRSPEEPEIGDLWSLDDQPYYKARMDLIKAVPGWWRTIPPLEDGFQIYKLAQEIGFDCRILTKGPRKAAIAWTEKLQCIQDHLGDRVHVSVVTSKGETYGKFLYDDFPEYMESWLKWRKRGLGIMPVNESNKNFHHPQVIKWDGTNFDEVKHALKMCYDRTHGEPLALR